MELEQITTAVRPRSPWEAMDLGFHLARRWWKAMLLPWAVVTLVPAALLSYLCIDWPWLALLLFWFFKPLYDRIPLYVLSRALFNATPSWRESLAALPRLLTQDLPWTLLYRPDLARSFNLPIRQLEGLRGQESRKRIRLLQRRYRGHAVGLSFAFMWLEVVALMSLLYLAPLFLPDVLKEELLLDLFRTAFEGNWMMWLFTGLYVLVVFLLEPFYVAAGFTLYLNRRTLLEAWDVELSFRQLTRRLAGTAVICLALLSGTLLLTPTEAMAEAPEVHTEIRPASESKQIIEEIMQRPELDGWREVSRWKYIGEEDEEEEEYEWDGFGFDLGRLFARFTEALLWIGLAVGIILLLVHRDKWLHLIWRSRPKPRPQAPEKLFGLDIRPESLPEDVPLAARLAWEAGRHREALSLLYRGALAALVHDEGVEFAEGDTERDCLRTLQPKVEDSLYEHFKGMTQAWQLVAYAHRQPADETVYALCDSWHSHYGRTP